jgi:ribonuclease BN (tRNA processing enzyme)
MKGAGIDPASIDTIVISHLHGDHFGGLPFFLLDAQLNSKRSTPLIVAGHADLEQRLRAAMDILFPGSQRALEVVDVAFVTLAPGTPTRLGPASVEVFAVEHFCGSPPFAIRLTTPTGKTIGYSGDTEWTDTLTAVADNADLFIAEAYFYDKTIKWHLDYTSLAKETSRLNARRLIATHLSADMLARLDDVQIDVAHDGLTIEL